jgi:hypothetical protein
MGRRGCRNVGVWRLLYLCAFLFFVLMVSSANAQGVYEAWVGWYDGPGNGEDQARAIAVDKNGYIYVVGYSDQIGDGSYQLTVITYGLNGDTLWLRRYNAAFAYDLTVDDSGYLYIAGSNADYVTIKCKPNGDTVWVRYYQGPWFLDRPNALAVDAGGNVYVTGESENIAGYEVYSECATIKYAPNGDTLWVRRLNSSPGEAIAVDTNGNVYVVIDSATIKYLPDGSTAWIRSFSGDAVALDHQGSVYVAGHSNGYFATIKFAPNGDTAWLRTYVSADSFGGNASALAVDDSGNVYVTGYDTGFPNDTILYYSGDDIITVKYDKNGDTLWTQRWNGPANLEDDSRVLKLDDSGNVYVAGYADEHLFLSYSKSVTIKYSPDGQMQWAEVFDPVPGLDFDNEAYDLAVDHVGNAYVTGWVTVDNQDFLTIKYSPCSALPGDVNSSSSITLGDIVHLLNYVFDRDYPPCLGTDPGNCWDFGLTCRGDVNNSASITLGDIVHLLNYVFDRDYPPCIGTDPGNCWTPVASGACCLL